jgi:hypothetical protein
MHKQCGFRQGGMHTNRQRGAANQTIFTLFSENDRSTAAHHAVPLDSACASESAQRHINKTRSALRAVWRTDICTKGAFGSRSDSQ